MAGVGLGQQGERLPGQRLGPVRMLARHLGGLGGELLRLGGFGVGLLDLVVHMGPGAGESVHVSLDSGILSARRSGDDNGAKRAKYCTSDHLVRICLSSAESPRPPARRPQQSPPRPY